MLSQISRKNVKVKRKNNKDDEEDIHFEDLPTGQPPLSPAGKERPPSAQMNIEMSKVTSSKTELLAANNETLADHDEDDSPRRQEALGYEAVPKLSEEEII